MFLIAAIGGGLLLLLLFGLFGKQGISRPPEAEFLSPTTVAALGDVASSDGETTPSNMDGSDMPKMY